jgi:hypothetical protein
VLTLQFRAMRICAHGTDDVLKRFRIDGVLDRSSGHKEHGFAAIHSHGNGNNVIHGDTVADPQHGQTAQSGKASESGAG